MKARVTLRTLSTGEVQTHAAGGPADYDTICGCAGDSDLMEIIATPQGQRIDCARCHEIFVTARALRKDDFQEAKR